MTENIHENNIELPTGIAIFLDKKLDPYTMKEKGFINGQGKEIVTEVYVGEEVYNRLKEEYGDSE